MNNKPLITKKNYNDFLEFVLNRNPNLIKAWSQYIMTLEILNKK